MMDSAAPLPLPLPHIAIFPFMAKGHTIPLIHLAHLIHRRRLATLTFFTTPLNAPFIRTSLTGTEAAIVELPFPQNVPDLPPGVENTDRLPSISLLLPFVNATKLLQPHLEQALARLPTISFLISDGFFFWTTKSSSKFGIPNMVFTGMGYHSTTVSAIVFRDWPHAGIASDDQPFTVPGLPQVRLTKDDLVPPFKDPDDQRPLHELVSEVHKARRDSHGVVVNSFYELEAAYLDYWNSNVGPKSWCIGPLCLARPKSQPTSARHKCMVWLDSRSALNRPVLYIAFGTHAEVSASQLQEIAIGLERSGLDFLWVVRATESDLGEGFEERVANRGMVVREWVDQMEILCHESIRGHLSHCGWNSVTESICAGVPILAWPMLADNRLNAKLLVEELQIGLRLRASDGTRNGLVRREDIEDMVKELLLGEKGKLASVKVKDLAMAAENAMMDGGSSDSMLALMVDEVCQKRTAF